jgi:hypothetical protein
MKHALLLFLLVSCQAQTVLPLSHSRPEAVRLQGLEYVVPQLIIGGEWTSSIKLTNRGAKAIPTTNVFFVNNTGVPMTTTFQASNGSIVTDTGFSFSLAVGGLIDITFLGGANAQFGHAIIDCSALGCGTPGLYGEVALRNKNSTRPDFESVFPFEQPASIQYMLFDGRNGLTTTLYVVNNSTTAATVFLDVVDSSNRLLRTIPLSMAGLESQIQTLHVLSQETIGIEGTLVFRTQSASSFATATALRINPSNSFTPVRAFVPAP